MTASATQKNDSNKQVNVIVLFIFPPWLMSKLKQLLPHESKSSLTGSEPVLLDVEKRILHRPVYVGKRGRAQRIERADHQALPADRIETTQ